MRQPFIVDRAIHSVSQHLQSVPCTIGQHVWTYLPACVRQCRWTEDSSGLGHALRIYHLVREINCKRMNLERNCQLTRSGQWGRTIKKYVSELRVKCSLDISRNVSMSTADATTMPVAESGVRLCHRTSRSKVLPTQVPYFHVTLLPCQIWTFFIFIVLVIGTALRSVVQARQPGSLLTLPCVQPIMKPHQFIFYSFLIHVCHAISPTGYCTRHTLKITHCLPGIQI